jgi:Pentapeptide repeats (8 copies)
MYAELKEKLAKILEEHKKWLADSNTGVRASLLRADLTRADLTGANLTEADLTGASLTGADLIGANLTRADLTRASLTGANLTRASLIGANLIGADLTRASLIGADLTGADLTRADLTGADLDYSSFPLRCSSTKCKVDDRLFRQLLYHALVLCPENNPIKKTGTWKTFIDEANKFHQADECGKIGE